MEKRDLNLLQLMNPIKIKLASTESELFEIKNLQRINLKGNLSESEKKSEGFLTAEYTLSFLKKINQDSPAIIVKKDKVVGYALAVSKKIGKQNELLNHLINEFDKQKYKDINLVNENYIVVGQLCLDKSIRGMGYVEKIYSQFKETYKNYRYCLTAVDLENKRSSAIHKKCGFLRIGQLMLNENPGEIILWDLKN
ncbi:N-acetyltransferase [Bacteroidetes bacterium SCGC AAA795-G10]|nr:N-acetyltransferase [Bacteroidetes bacterium SCGC AAA795-G10]